VLKLLKNSLKTKRSKGFLLLLRHDTIFLLSTGPILVHKPDTSWTYFVYSSNGCFSLHFLVCAGKKNELTLRAGEFTFHNPRLSVGPALNRLHHVCVLLNTISSLFLQVWGITSYPRCRGLAGCKRSFGIRHKVTTVTFNWIGFKNSFCKPLERACCLN
jgi:hypothetical protein